MLCSLQPDGLKIFIIEGNLLAYVLELLTDTRLQLIFESPYAQPGFGVSIGCLALLAGLALLTFLRHSALLTRFASIRRSPPIKFYQ